MRPERLFGAALAAVVVGFVAGWLAYPWPELRSWTMELGWVLAPLLGGTAALYASRKPANEATRRSWRFLGLGALTWAAGETYWAWSVLAVGEEPQLGSWADVGWIGAMPLLAAGVAAWPRRRRVRRNDLLDGLVGLLVAALVTFEFSVEPILLDATPGSATWVALAYPVCESLVVATVLIGVLLNLWADRGRLLLVGAGLVALASADTAFSEALSSAQQWSTLIDPIWVLSFATLGAAALAPPRFLAGRFHRVPWFVYVVAVTIGLAAVAIADAVESPEELAVGATASYALAVLLVFGVTGFLALARARERTLAERRRTQSALKRAQGVRDRFMVQLVNAQERDAHKIADLLHDEVVQQLTALQLRLELKSQLLDDATLRDLASDSRDVIATIRRLLVELHPAILDSQGLAPAVDVVADALRERGLDVHVAPFPHRLTREREVLAYRLVQEALTNVLRHARAGSAEVEFSLDGDVLHGRVADTGWGIRGEQGDGLGLVLARERVELAGGRFTVRPREPQGTEVLFALPGAVADVEEVAA